MISLTRAACFRPFSLDRETNRVIAPIPRTRLCPIPDSDVLSASPGLAGSRVVVAPAGAQVSPQVLARATAWAAVWPVARVVPGLDALRASRLAWPRVWLRVSLLVWLLASPPAWLAQAAPVAWPPAWPGVGLFPASFQAWLPAGLPVAARERPGGPAATVPAGQPAASLALGESRGRPGSASRQQIERAFRG